LTTIMYYTYSDMLPVGLTLLGAATSIIVEDLRV